jgi:transketolase
VPGIEMSTGALGHGLPIGVGMAIAEKRLGTDRRVFVVMGDGEQAEGSVWEGAMSGANYKLDNLYAVIDRNRLQISGSTEDVMALENFADKWRAFGWDVCEVDGNDMEALVSYFKSQRPDGKPHCLVANTVKGKGLPFAENRAEWHHHVPSAEQLQLAYEVLGVKGVDWA